MLIGCTLVRQTDRGKVSGIIVETEAYHQLDPASHSYKGRNPRNAIMFGDGGFSYVYRSYGIHHCFNVVAGDTSSAEAVLIRSVEPIEGINLMRQRRGIDEITKLCSGPGRLTQAFAIGLSQNGTPLDSPEIHILARSREPEIMATPRIGITKAKDNLWRFIVRQSPFVSPHRYNRIPA